MLRLPPYLISGPSALPVALDEVKTHLRVDHADEDALMARLMAAATAHVDGHAGVLGQALITQTWEVDASAWRCGPLALSPGPVQAIVAIAITSPDGSAEAVPMEGYRIDAMGTVRPVSTVSIPTLPSEDHTLTVRFRAGFGDTPAHVPEPIRHAIILLVAHWYHNREAVVVGAQPGQVPLTVDRLLAPMRRHTI